MLKRCCGCTAAELCAHVEVLRLNSEGLLDLKLVRWVIHSEVEVLQQDRHHQQGFLPCKWPTDAASHAISKRLPGVWILLLTTVELFIKHPFGSELLRVFSIYSGIAMNLRKECDERCVGLDRVFATNQSILLRSDSDRWCRRRKTQRFS